VSKSTLWLVAHTHQRLRHWRHTLALLVAELGEAESDAGIEDRMLNDKAMESAPHVFSGSAKRAA
jgi:hypothetical protein